MTEVEAYLEYFYNNSMSRIEKERAEYLKKRKSIPFKQSLPPVREACASSIAKMNILQKIVYFITLKRQRRKYRKALRKQKRPMSETLTKGYNAGIEHATRVFRKCFENAMEKVQDELE